MSELSALAPSSSGSQSYTSYSELSTFLHCSLQHFYRYHLRLATRRYSEKRALHVGSITHDGIDMIYAEDVDAEDPDEFDRVFDSVSGKVVREYEAEKNVPYGPNDYDWAVDLALSRGLLGVFATKIRPTEEYRLVASEYAFDTIVCGTRMIGFIDAIYALDTDDGPIYFVGEVKTWAASRSVTKLEEHTRKDLQTDLYAYILNRDPKFAGRVVGKVYTVYRKPSSKVMSKKGHASLEDHIADIERFYKKSKATHKRVEVRGLASDASVEARVRSILSKMQTFYDNPYRSASRYEKGHPDYFPCGFCEFRKLCHKNAAPDASFRYKKRRQGPITTKP